MAESRSLSGKTNIVGLIGWPVSHSVSPPMHNRAFATLGFDWHYIPLPVPIEPAHRIGEAVNGIRALGLRGANVTVPHKQAVMPYLDEISPAARAIGAVNTIVVHPDHKLYGDNTDARGFLADLNDHDVDPRNTRVLVLGAGGSARAVVYALAEAGAQSIAIANRTLAKADHLAKEIEPLFPNSKYSTLPLPDGIAGVAHAADLIINCTSLGMTPNFAGLPWDEAVSFTDQQTVYDLIYNPTVTRLLDKANSDGAQTIGGIGMLIWQGAIAFELWTDHPAPVDEMRAAVQAAFSH